MKGYFLLNIYREIVFDKWCRFSGPILIKNMPVTLLVIRCKVFREVIYFNHFYPQLRLLRGGGLLGGAC